MALLRIFLYMPNGSFCTSLFCSILYGHFLCFLNIMAKFPHSIFHEVCMNIMANHFCNIPFFHNRMVVLFIRAWQLFVAYYGFSRLFSRRVLWIRCILGLFFVSLNFLGEALAVFGPTKNVIICFSNSPIHWLFGLVRRSHLGWSAEGELERLFGMGGDCNE